jgi:2-dehydropantoate 2-reductase
MAAIHIVGAGGIGCAVGYALAEDAAVTFVESSATKIAYGRQYGVAVGTHRPRPAAFVPFAEWSPPAGAVVLLCTKCYDNAAVLARLPESVCLVPIQNGFDTALLARPPHVEGIASFVSECLPGRTHTRITRAGRLHLGVTGRPSSADTPHLHALLGELATRLKRAPFPVTVVPEILPYKHTKLMYNAALSPLASAAGIDNGDVLRRKDIRALFFALLRENHAILRGAGAELGKVGPLHPDTVARILARPWLAHALAWAFYPGLRGTYCSMANDLPAGRTEIEHYNGYLISLASGGRQPPESASGGRATPEESSCPLNRRVYTLIKTMEKHRLPPAPERLFELLNGIEARQEESANREDCARFAG